MNEEESKLFTGPSETFAKSMSVAYERWDEKEKEYRNALLTAKNEIKFWEDSFNAEVRSNLKRQEILIEKNLQLKAKIKILSPNNEDNK